MTYATILNIWLIKFENFNTTLIFFNLVHMVIRNPLFYKQCFSLVIFNTSNIIKSFIIRLLTLWCSFIIRLCILQSKTLKRSLSLVKYCYKYLWIFYKTLRRKTRGGVRPNSTSNRSHFYGWIFKNVRHGNWYVCDKIISRNTSETVIL